MTTRLNVALVDAFTRTAGAGNRAGVVSDVSGLTADTMLAAAGAVAASETAFVDLESDRSVIRMRYFTPAAEVPFCGHASVASFHYLAETGRISAPGRFVFECAAGRFEAELEHLEGAVRIWLVTPQHPWTESPIEVTELMRLLGGDIRMLDATLPVRRSGPKVFVPLARRRDLFALQPRWDELATTGVRVFAFTREVVEPGSVAHGRFFAPVDGIREDPVTGAANGPLAAYLVQHGVLKLPHEPGIVRARAEQGDAMGKPGRIELEVMGSQGHLERVRIGGTATTVLTGELRLG